MRQVSTGPYQDASGNDSLLSDGTRGGTILDQTNGWWVGPGGEFLLHDTDGGWLMVHHAYDSEKGGTPTLRIKDLYFHDGWPTYTPYPTVHISSSSTSSPMKVGSTITITALASESIDGSSLGNIRQVDFYQAGTLLGSATSEPFSYAWKNAAVGTYSVTAVATDKFGHSSPSAMVTLSVAAGH